MVELLERKGLKRSFALGLILIGIILFLGGIIYILIHQRAANPTSAPLPTQVANLDLVNRSFGRQAMAEVIHLHNQEFLLTSASVGRYGHEHSITIWTTGAPLRIVANRLVIEMRDRIDKTDTPFNPIGERRHGNRVIYELTGLGQKHFYFQSANLIVWMAADEQLADQALVELLEFYP
ncbi:MAG: hypothetical protein IBX69_08310 [Anaerolineales bacterium]|nr:hypothetical protein [Anaerolineales bacterium]